MPLEQPKTGYKSQNRCRAGRLVFETSPKVIVEAIVVFLNGGYEWIVDIDLEKFFDNVPQDGIGRRYCQILCWMNWTRS